VVQAQGCSIGRRWVGGFVVVVVVGSFVVAVVAVVSTLMMKWQPSY